jgi:deoxycytidylate deaminase
MDRHVKFVNFAAGVASTSNHPRWQVGAIIVRSGNIISAAPNSPRNAPWLMLGLPGASWHAEDTALRKLTRQADRAEGAVLYVARINRSSDLRLARPCPVCYSRIIAAGVRTIVYSTNGPGYGIERTR